jgi:hypothetical protein
MIRKELEELRRQEAALAGGGAERQQRQHQEGKLSARERCRTPQPIPSKQQRSTMLSRLMAARS